MTLCTGEGVDVDAAAVPDANRDSDQNLNLLRIGNNFELFESVAKLFKFHCSFNIRLEEASTGKCTPAHTFFMLDSGPEDEKSGGAAPVFRLQHGAFRARAALIAKIYSKGLTLSFHSRQGKSSGEVINLMAVDAERIYDFGWYMHEPWRILVQVVLALILLYKNLGLAFVATFFATLFVMMVNYPAAKLLEKFQGELMKSKDGRMKVTSEVLRNMWILKFQAWEMRFLSKIQGLRNTETGWLKKYLYTSAITSFTFFIAPVFVFVVTFGACFLMGIPLESGKILSALATFKVLQETIYTVPKAISVIVQAKVSLDRIASYLCLPDLPSDVVEKAQLL